MSIASALATGSGKFRWRIAIAGLPYEFVSHESMETTLGGNERRICCIGPEAVLSIILDERVSPIDVVPESTSIAVELADTREKLSELFHKKPTKGTWLRLGMDASGTTMDVQNADGWTTGDRAFVNQETMEIAAVDTVNHEFTVTRAFWDSDARAHYVEGDGAELRSVEVTNWPRLMTGRRVRIFWYGEGDNPTGLGSLFWSGIVAREPEQAGAFWRIEFDPTTRKLDQTVGTGLGDPLVPRGIVYAGGALEVEIVLHSSADRTSTEAESARVTIGVREHAFFEDQEAFVAELNTRIAAALTGWTGNPRVTAIADGADNWWFIVEIGSVARYITVFASSPVDGVTTGGLFDADNLPITTVIAAQIANVVWSDTSVVPGQRTVPRGVYGQYGLRGPTRDGGGATTAAGGENRIYVDSDVSLSGVLAVLVEWPQNGTLEETAQVQFVDAVSTANRSLDIRYATGPDGRIAAARPYTSAAMPRIKIWRVYVTSGHVGDFVVALIGDSTDETNRAGAPDVSQYDFSLSAWQSFFDELTSTRPLHANRLYALGGEVDLGELLKHECRLVSVFMGFSAQGALVPKLVQDFADTDPSVIDVDVVFEVPEDRPTCQLMKLGSIRGAVVKSGYEPGTDEWEGPTFTVLDAVANSRNPLAAMMDVEPRSTFPNPGIAADSQTARDAHDGVAPMIGAMGYPYAVYKVTTSLKAKNVLLGDGVRFTLQGRWLPNPETGDRTPATIVGQVMARTVNPARARVTLEVRTTLESVVGYAPAAGVSAQSNVSGNTWDLTARLKDPWVIADWGEDEGDTIADHFAAGYTCRLYEWAVSAPTELECTIVSVTPGTNTIRVTTAGVWTPGTNKWVLIFDETLDASAAQQRYAWYADSERVIQFTSPRRARVFAG